MRPKDKQINPGNDISEQILNLLKRNQGDETLYSLSKHIGMQQGTLRRKLENPNGWNEINYINKILEFFNISYDALFYRSNVSGQDLKIIETLENEISELIELNNNNNMILESIKRLNGNDIIEFAMQKIKKDIMSSAKILQPGDSMHIDFSNFKLKSKLKK